MRLTDPACRFSFAFISDTLAPSRTSRTNACFSASVHSFGFGLMVSVGGFSIWRYGRSYFIDGLAGILR
jgi:hypothetical protein